MRRLLWSVLGTGLLGMVCGVAAQADGPAKADKKEPPAPNKPTEPRAKAYSFQKGVQFLDEVSLNWTEKRRCATCHTNVAHLLARATLGGKPSEAETQVRDFFEKRVANWDSGERADRPKNDSDVVVTAVSLAFNDSARGKLHPLTRKALDRMWAIQQKDGAWNWEKCEWPPLEHDDYYGAVFAAVGVGIAPEGYASTDKAKAGLERLKGYLKKTPAPTLHHQVWLLWASQKVDGLMTPAEREKTVQELLARQKPDGGWSLPSLGDWKGFDGRDNNMNAASDGYGTGFVVYALLQSGLKKDHAAVKKGIAWLKANQRESGRWFTQSLNTDRAHYITHAGTAFALLALKACE